MILSVYDISKAVGPDGKIVEPTCEYTSGIVRYVAFNEGLNAMSTADRCLFAVNIAILNRSSVRSLLGRRRQRD